MKIGIIGSRRRDTGYDENLVRLAFRKVLDTINEDEAIIVSGGCPKGGDRFAELIAKDLSIPIKIFRANWKLGRHAGFLRNTDIAKESDILIACVVIDRTGGTEDTIKKYLKLNKTALILV
jgi:hypothetical protein